MKLGISSSLVVCVLSLTLSVACAFDEFEVNDSSLEVALLEVFTLVPNQCYQIYDHVMLVCHQNQLQ